MIVGIPGVEGSVVHGDFGGVEADVGTLQRRRLWARGHFGFLLWRQLFTRRFPKFGWWR